MGNAQQLAEAGVRQIPPPPAARGLSRLAHVDYADAFLVETPVAHERTAEEWARAFFDDVPAHLRKALRRGWFALGLKLGPTRSDRLVFGWEPRRSTPDVALLGAGGRLGLSGELLFKREEQAMLFCTFVQLGNPIARLVWGRVEPGHVRIVRYLLGHAGCWERPLL